MFIPRDFSRSEEDDFKINVRLTPTEWATPLYSEEGQLLGWLVKPAYE